MEALKRRLTEKEWNWIRSYFEAGGNASEATRRVYGGTLGACRVKGHKKVKKFKAILKEIMDRELHQMECNGMTGIDFYLGDRERQVQENKTLLAWIGGARGLTRMFKRPDKISSFFTNKANIGKTF